MGEMRAKLQFSEAFPEEARTEIRKTFADEGIETEVASNDIAYKGAAVSPDNLIIDFVSLLLLTFLNGYVSAAGADAWAATKRAFKRVPAASHGGQELHFSVDDGTTHARYILPNDPAERNTAIDTIADDFAVHEKLEERWWLGPPDSRWGSSLESAQRRNKNRD